MQELIETIALSKEFRDFWGRVKVKALDRLNLKVYRGEIFGLLGPNGSGKTTTIKLLLGLLFPTSGKIKILGKSPHNIENKKYIGFLPEETYLYPYQNAEESLFFYGRLFGLSQNLCRKRVQDLLEMVGLTKARSRPLKEYSKGMARRIGIAQALINDPELIFLDEPTTGLDPIGTKEIKDLIVHLKKCGKTIILCSHLLSDVEDICDRVAILYGGKVRCEGTISDLLTKHQTTQISLDGITEEKLQELSNWLQKQNIFATLERPKERLESFFLRVVQEARTQQIPTSGAEAGKIMTGLFSTQNLTNSKNTTNDVINQLLHSESDNNIVQNASEKTPSTLEVIKEPESTFLQQLLTQQKKIQENTTTKSLEVSSESTVERQSILNQLLPETEQNKNGQR